MNDKRINYIKLERNSGACVARNTRIKKIFGTYIAFNDSDDEWLPEKTKKQLDFLQKKNTDIVLCKLECRTPENKFIHNFPSIKKDKQISYKDLLKYKSASTQSIFGKAECFKDILFDSTMPRLQDWDETFLQKDSISTHPEKGITAMQKLFEKHKDAILSSPDIAESFCRKKSFNFLQNRKKSYRGDENNPEIPQHL